MATKETPDGLGISPETAKDYLGRLMGCLGLMLLQELKLELDRDERAM